MPMCPGRPLACGLAALIASTALAHPDDPKVRDTMPRYEGPGYRAAGGGIAGTVFDFDSVIMRSWITVGEFGNNHDWANDIWGYVSPSGREYAIIGLSDGTGFVEVTDPGDPQIVAVKNGPHSTWRDMKTYQHYAYVVTEGSGQQAGIQVFDLSGIDSGTVSLAGVVSTGPSTISTHNVALDETSGFLYRCGGGSNGLRIYDLANPATPVYVADWSDRYVHDAEIVTYTDGPWAGKQIAFCCGGFNGGWVQSGIDILDVTDKQDIQLISRYQYPSSRYSHQAWLSDDKQYLYLNDEADESQLGVTSRMHVIDVSDLENPFEATTYTNGSQAITHNLFVRGDFAFAANYRSGLRIFDVSDPLDAMEVGYFDTFPGSDSASFNGLWGTYPFLPSGNILGSDREKGLFVWIFGGASIDFSYPNGRPEVVDPAGESFQVNVSAGDGEIEPGSPKLHYDTGAGWQVVDLLPLENDLHEVQLPAVPCATSIQYYLSAATSDGLVWQDPVLAPSDTHRAVAATDEIEDFIDDAETDLGWFINALPSLTDGLWARGTPAGGGAAGDPPTDADGAGQCYATGLAAGSDVDGGFTMLRSPLLDTSGGGLPFISYDRWFYSDSSNPTTDRFTVEVMNAETGVWSVLEEVDQPAQAWSHASFEVFPVTGVTGSIYVRFTARDEQSDDTVEVAVDNIEIRYLGCFGGDPADVNGDGVVSVDDLVAVISNWGPCPPPCDADVNGDGNVDVNDLVAVFEAWD